MRPCGSKSTLTCPPRSLASVRSNNTDPKPRRDGGETAGPPLSCHRRQSWGCGPSVWYHTTLIRPLSVERAPYFLALVQSSCKAIASETACFGESRTLGPLSAMTSVLLHFVPSVTSASSFSETFSQLAFVSRS